MFGVRSWITKSVISVPDVIKQQSRNTFILKRRNPVPLHKKGGRPGKLRARHFIYDLVEDINVIKEQNMNIILTQFVEGHGYPGDMLSLKPSTAYQRFLLPGLATYATPEKVEELKKKEIKNKPEDLFSSPYVQRTINCLSRLQLQITMSKLNPWTLEKWHVRASFRKVGFVVPEHAIEMPPVEIQGPDLSLQDKEFYVTVSINNKEKVNVRCRIHHWATGLDRLPWEEYFWRKPKEPLVPEQADVLANIPLRD